MPPLYRIDVGKEVFYALDEGEREGILDRIEAEKRKGKVTVTRFKGPRRDESRAAARNDDAPRHAPAGAADDRARRQDLQDHGHDAGEETPKDRKDWLETKGDLAEV